MLWNIMGCYGVLWDVMKCYGMLWDVMGPKSESYVNR